MEVKIGVQNVAREITFESNASSDELTQAVTAALEGGSVLRLSDERGRQVIVAAGAIGYVQLGESDKRGVGFGTL